MIKEKEILFQVNQKRFLKRIHIDSEKKQDEELRERVLWLEEQMRSQTIQMVYRKGEGDFSLGIREMDNCPVQIVCLVSIGENLNQKIDGLLSEEKYLEAYLLDQMASEALFLASEKLNEMLCRDMKSEGWYLVQKAEAGMGDIPLEKQKDFLEIIREKRDIGVRVNDAGMLLPEKTMVYAFGADKEEKELCLNHDCRQCSRKDCGFRME